METCMAPAALCPSPLESILGQLRRFLAALMAEGNTQRKAAANREAVNRQAERLLTDYGNSILRLAYSYLHNMSDVEEVLQDTLIQFLRTAPALDGPEHEKAWLLRVTSKMRQRVLERTYWRYGRMGAMPIPCLFPPAFRRKIGAQFCSHIICLLHHSRNNFYSVHRHLCRVDGGDQSGPHGRAQPEGPVDVTAGDAEHIQRPHGDLNEQNAAPFKVNTLMCPNCGGQMYLCFAAGFLALRKTGNHFVRGRYSPSSGNVTCQLPLVSFAPVQNAPHT